MVIVNYEIYLRKYTEEGETDLEIITKYRYKTKEKAIEKLKTLNKNLKHKDYQYVIAKVTREYIKACEIIDFL